MSLAVTSLAERREVVFDVAAGVAAEFAMMDLQLSKAAAVLTPPVIPLHHPFTQLAVIFWSQPKAGLLGPDALHDTFTLACLRKAWRWD
jgi:hypothetical protein